MARRPTKRDLSTGILIGLLAGVLVAQTMGAGATHQPANKAAASGRKIVVVGPDTEEPILAATMKTSKVQDLVFSVTLECSIITQTFLPGGENATNQSDNAEGLVRVWVEIDDIVVPISSSVSPPNDPSQPGDDSDKVTFCNREQEHEITDNEEDEGGSNPDGDGLDTQRLYLASKTANAFNWLYMNAGSDVHEIVVYADLVTEDPPCPDDPQAQPITCSEALIGNRTLMVFPERLSNDAQVA